MIEINKSKVWWTFLQFIIVSIGLSVIVFSQQKMIVDFYLNGQVSQLGLILNGLIFMLFSLGMLRIIFLLLHYSREQDVLSRLLKRLESGNPKPLQRLSNKSSAVQRYNKIALLVQKQTVVNHAALAANLNAREHARLTLLRFVQNSLILLGVFGTIVSLSIALVGASNVLGSGDNLQNIGVIVDGMSTALSTTVTAIVCFVIYVYFYLRLRAIQTEFIAAIEDMTTFYLLPGISHDENSLLQGLGNLVTELRQLIDVMRLSQQGFADSGQRLQLIVNDLQQHAGHVGQDMRDIKALLREGFRLPWPAQTPSKPKQQPPYPSQIKD